MTHTDTIRAVRRLEDRIWDLRRALERIAATTHHAGNVDHATRTCDKREECPLCIARAVL